MPPLKPGSTETRLQKREEKMKIFFDFLEVTYQKSPKTDPFSEGIMQKTENWHFGDHRIWVSELHRDMPGSCLAYIQN